MGRKENLSVHSARGAPQIKTVDILKDIFAGKDVGFVGNGSRSGLCASPVEKSNCGRSAKQYARFFTFIKGRFCVGLVYGSFLLALAKKNAGVNGKQKREESCSSKQRKASFLPQFQHLTLLESQNRIFHQLHG